MTRDQALSELDALSDPKVRERNARNGAGGNQYGVKLGDIRKVAKRIKTDTGLARELWATGNLDARLLATLIIRPKGLSADDLDAMVRSVASEQVADWLNAYVVKRHPEKEALRQRWLGDADPMAARAGWALTAQRIAKDPEGLDFSTLLDGIEAEMSDAPPEAQWTMNTALAEIGIRSPEHRERALAIGEALGVYRDYPVSRGCTSPFAPIWIREMVSRQA